MENNPAIHHPGKTISAAEAMALPRAQRRLLAKQNGLDKIPGTNTDHLKIRVINKLREQNAPENIINFFKKHNRMPKDEEELKKEDATTS